MPWSLYVYVCVCVCVCVCTEFVCVLVQHITQLWLPSRGLVVWFSVLVVLRVCVCIGLAYHAALAVPSPYAASAPYAAWIGCCGVEVSELSAYASSY
jgi:hypothetical protein